MTDDIKDKLCNTGAERQILANCLNNTDYIIACDTEGLTPRHFNIPVNQAIYNAIMYLYTKNLTVDTVSIASILNSSKAHVELEKMGGDEYLFLIEQSPVTQNISLFCKEVMNEYIKRQTYTMCENIQLDILSKKDIDIVGLVNQRTLDLTLENTRKNITYKMGDAIEQRMKSRLERQTLVPGIPVGWDKFDRITGGGQAGDLIIVVAESKTGKSVTLLNWAKHMTIDLNLPILWIDTEQSDDEQETRLLSMVSQVPEDEIKTGLFMQDTFYGTSADKQQRLALAVEHIKRSKLFHVFMPDFTIEKMIAKTKEYYLKEGICAIFFDYIQLTDTLINHYRGMRDDVILTTFTTGLKTIAGELKIPVFTASQENRTGYGSTEKDAKNIGGSIGILQKASKLLFLRNMTDEEICMNRNSNQKLLIKYQRHGNSGDEINIFYDRPRITQKES